MKLGFVALVFLLTLVAGNRPSTARRVSYGAQRSNVEKPTVAGQTRLHSHPSLAGKPVNSYRGNAGKTHHQQLVLTPKPKAPTSKSANAKSNKNTSTLKPPKPKNVVYSKNTTDRQAQQQNNVGEPVRSPKLNPTTEKLGRSNSAKDGKTQQKGKTPTSTLKPPKAGKSDHSHTDQDGRTLEQQDAAENTPTSTMNPGKAEKSGNTNSGKHGQSKQQQIAAQNTLTSTLKTPTIEKSGNSSNGRDGQLQQQQNVSQHTTTLKLPSTEKSDNSSSDKVGEPLQQNTRNFSSRTEHHHHYLYSPPQKVSYRNKFHPVYQGHPPVYVYEYRDSGSRFDNLLTGLALYNLGRNSHSHYYSSDRQYSSIPGEICKLGICKRSGDYEETRIDCNLMSSFIWEETTSAARNEQRVVKNTTAVTVTQTVNGTTNSSVTTVTVTSNTVQDALKVKGPSIAVTPGMTCYMIRTAGAITTLRKSVDCGLLQEYARSSLFRNNAQCFMPFMTLALHLFIICFALY